jgi:predicted small lipoprotein YifL
MVYAMKKILLVCLYSLFCMFALAACGQKGALFLPGDPSQIQTEVSGQGGIEDENENENENENEEEKPNPETENL